VRPSTVATSEGRPTASVVRVERFAYEPVV